jgi:hypothetical protein
MSFFNDISRILGGGTGNIVEGYNIVNVDGKALYIDGVKRILEIGDTSIRLSTKKAIIEVLGIDLVVSQSNRDTIILRGTITNINLS